MRRVALSIVACSLALACLSILRASDLPNVPQEVRELMQDRKFDDAVTAIGGLLSQDEKPKNADYLHYLKGRALHLAGKHREALETFAAFEREHAASPWARRAKFGQAAALLKLGDFEAAEHIYEEEVRFLLSAQRKQEIASIYLEFADAYFDPPKKGADGGSVTEKKPDFAKALNFYRQALAVGPEGERRIEIEIRVARCQQELGQHAEAATAYQAFLKAHPKSPFDIEARYRLGTVQLAQGQNVAARKTWKDLLDAHADHKVEVPKELLDTYPNAATQRLAEAAYGISHTYGLPNPPTKEDLELGVAAADRFIANFADLKLAARSSLEVAQAFVKQNRHDQALDRLKKLLANPKYVATDVIPDARVLMGGVYQRQKKFSEAIAAWQEYLTKHASHPSWSQVQQAIIDTEFLAALQHRSDGSRQAKLDERAKSYAEARRLWDAFLQKYPLDARAASIMLEFGLMKLELGEVAAKESMPAQQPDEPGDKPEAPGAPERFFAAAIADWTSLVSKYPGTEEASRAQYLIGLTTEEKLGKFDDALAAYRKLTWGQFAPRAAERISQLTRQSLAIETERVFRTTQQPRIKVSTRNIKQLTVKAYRVDLETYFRKMHLASGIESLDIALIDPERTWTFDVPDYTDYKQHTSHIDIPLDSPGVMAVTVGNELDRESSGNRDGIVVRPQEATTMVMRSDLDILVKCSRNELFVFAQNMPEGKPFAGVKLLVSDGQRLFAEGTTNEDGVFVGSVSDQDKSWDPLKTSGDIRVFALADPKGGDAANDEPRLAIPGAHFASNVVGLKGVEFAQGITAKGYIYTERPTYRPGQLVHVRGVVRWVKADEYYFDAGKKFKLDIYDSRGRQIRAEEVTLGEFGSFATHFALPAEAPQGDYRLHVHDPAEPDRHNYQGTFAVHEYQLQPILIEIDTPQKVYYRGDQVTGTIKLRYYYGAPVAGREIRYVVADGTIHTEKTNAAGEVAFKFETRDFREDQTLPIVVQYPEMNLQSGLNLFLSTHGFRATVATVRDVYLSGETFDVTVSTTDAAGKKTAEKMTLAVIQRTEQIAGPGAQLGGTSGERTIEELPVATDKDSGKGRVTIKVADAGTYILRASGTDRFGNAVSAERTITISGNDDTVRLRILADRHHYKSGDTAVAQIHWREAPALALVTYQGAHVLGYRLVELETGANKLEIPITEKLAPNFELTVSVMLDGGNRELALPSFHESTSPFEVERPLIVTIKPSRDRVRPGEDIDVAITTTDPQGRPVRAELSVAMIEKSLLEMFPDQLAAISQFFEGARRDPALRTVASCTFRYAPATHDISQTLIA
jgi:tetratricopeptide (TPR) repeat protein